MEKSEALGAPDLGRRRRAKLADRNPGKKGGQRSGLLEEIPAYFRDNDNLQGWPLPDLDGLAILVAMAFHDFGGSQQMPGNFADLVRPPVLDSGGKSGDTSQNENDYDAPENPVGSSKTT